MAVEQGLTFAFPKKPNPLIMKKIITALVALLFAGSTGIAQDAPSMYAVYEEHVKPSMDAAYVAAVKKLKAACEQNNADISWTSASFDDNTYVHYVPIKSFADMDKDGFAKVVTKLGKEAYAALWQDINKCVESHDSFVASRIPALSYLTATPEDNYREILYWYPEPGREGEAEKLLNEWITLFQGKKAVSGVSTWRTAFGTDNFYAFISWGKNELDLATKDSKNNELFGEEDDKLWAKTLTMTKKTFRKTGWMRRDLSYSAAAPAAGSK